MVYSRWIAREHYNLDSHTGFATQAQNDHSFSSIKMLRQILAGHAYLKMPRGD